MHQFDVFGGIHWSGDWSPFTPLIAAPTAISCWLPKSLANASRRPVVQVSAPDRHALASATTWSMLTCDGSVKYFRSYTLYQRPSMGRQAESTVTPVPSRLSTVSRVLHEPETTCQCGNFVRLYPVIGCAGATVSVARCARVAVGPGGADGYANAGLADSNSAGTSTAAIANAATIATAAASADRRRAGPC